MMGKQRPTSRITRFVAVALFLMMIIITCLAADRKVLMAKMIMNKAEDRNLSEENEKGDVGYGIAVRSVNNHHYIPREDFNNFGGGGSNGGVN
ncbi:uncharacterized protein LOC121238417 isoform X2 [Juglans microcarpa x Juglans regia]|uniref:uncharacterized protein LOC121238417 isoform X2 n=1 Tax=Juglans microcarpa x Juglans regia TaxID=2249226 RepID=UPI001B7E0E06|nr:uncharacterized protein LOC121238417 isoform X2 [Juglans microcarpa x Juglans regia]